METTTLSTTINPFRYQITYRADKLGRETLKVRVHCLKGDAYSGGLRVQCDGPRSAHLSPYAHSINMPLFKSG